MRERERESEREGMVAIASEPHKRSIRLADIYGDTREINFNKCKCCVA